MAEAAPAPRFLAAGDRALLVRFAEQANDEALERVWSLSAALAEQPVAGLVHWQPAYASLLLRFDPLRTDAERLEASVRELLAAAPAAMEKARGGHDVEVPVAYGGVHGPDLQAVAAHCGLTAEAVVAAHSAASYRVAFFGFVAGFAYLSGLPAGLATPRLAEPRRRVVPGSVAIGGRQTAIYPAATPGGWRLIGRTPLRPASFAGQPRTLFDAGDRLRFVPISAVEFERLSQWR